MLKLLLAALALVGVIGVFPIAQKQFLGTALCPALGPIPACYLVLLGYALIVNSTLVGKRIKFLTFATGAIPLFVLALTGSGIELSGQAACPRSSGGTPTCFLSLGLVGLIVIVYLADRHYDSSS
jgi:hypothetical protein